MIVYVVLLVALAAGVMLTAALLDRRRAREIDTELAHRAEHARSRHEFLIRSIAARRAGTATGAPKHAGKRRAS